MIFLGIDCGTQSTKTIAIDLETGAVLASAHQSYDFVPGLPHGAREQNPRDWIDAAQQTIDSVMTELGPRRSAVRGIGVSGQQHGLVPLDAAGQVVRPAKLWCDTATAPQCETITRHFGGESKVIDLVGNAMLPGYTAPKILWLRENEPENWARTKTLLLPHDYLNFWLTGEARMEYGDASGTALLDVKTRAWAAPMVDFLECGDKLPALGSSAQPAGVLREDLRHRWGLEAGVVVSAGGGDNMMAAIGTGNTSSGRVTASLGTSGTLFAFSEKPVIDDRGEIAAFCDSTDHWLPLLCTMNVTLVTELVRGLFDWSHSALDARVREIPAGADGLTLLPYLTGERTPNLPHGCGVLHGLTTENLTPAHLARAAMEGVTLGLGYGLQRLRELGVEPTEIHLTGGGSNSAAWRQICADVFGAPVACLRTSEGASLGAALQAAWAWSAAQGTGASLAELSRGFVKTDPESEATPNPANTTLYRERIAKMTGLRTALAGAGYL
jgi:xylulokinase